MRSRHLALLHEPDNIADRERVGLQQKQKLFEMQGHSDGGRWSAGAAELRAGFVYTTMQEETWTPGVLQSVY